jgi:hypothetical protein
MAGNSNNRTANDEKAIYEVEKICDHRRSKINNVWYLHCCVFFLFFFFFFLQVLNEIFSASNSRM